MVWLDRFFRDDETLAPRIPVISALLAYVLGWGAGLLGFIGMVAVMALTLILLVPVAYSALRALLPLMDPQHQAADPIAVWGGVVLILVVGVPTFGIMALPALAAGAILVARRAPELLEPFDMPDGSKEDTDALP